VHTRTGLSAEHEDLIAGRKGHFIVGDLDSKPGWVVPEHIF
jgi:hypothetical protein